MEPSSPSLDAQQHEDVVQHLGDGADAIAQRVGHVAEGDGDKDDSQDQIAGSNAQAKKVFKALNTQKTYLEFDASQGGQFHCQLGAPVVSSERILNWLDERAKP